MLVNFPSRIEKIGGIDVLDWSPVTREEIEFRMQNAPQPWPVEYQFIPEESEQ